ncbi:AAA family ATPase [Mycoplasmatota bacterium]|nr:AAA family ATPase [Mycoplasmatota bacterium]
MNILEIDLTYEKLNIVNQKIVFDKSKLCVIGKNGVGKTTLLRILERILTGRSYDSREFKLEPIQYLIKVKLNKEEFDMFFSQLVYSEENATFYVDNSIQDYKHNISSNSIPKEFDLVGMRINELNSRFIDLRYDYLKMFTKYLEENEYFDHTVPTRYSEDYLYRRCVESIFDKREEYVNDQSLCRSDRSGYSPRFDVSYSGSLFYDYKNSGNEYSDIKSFLGDFITLGESRFQILADKFISDNKKFDEDIYEVFSQINQLHTKFHALFTNHEGLRSYIDKNLQKKVLFLSTSQNHQQRLSKQLLDSTLLFISDEIYRVLYSRYQDDIIENKLDDKYIFNLIELHIFEDSNENTIEEYKDNGIPISEMKEYKLLQDNQEIYLQKIKDVIYNRHIVSDFESGFSGLLYQYKREIMLEKVLEILNEDVPDFDRGNIKEFNISNEDDKVEISFLEKGRESNTLLSETSSGRQWYISYKILANQLEGDNLLFIDEPASFLHLKAQKEIMYELMNLDQKVIYTTHSPLLLPEEDDGASIISLTTDDGETKIKSFDAINSSLVSENFGLNQLRNIIIKGTTSIVFIPAQIRKKILELGLEIDIEFATIFQDIGKYQKVTLVIDDYSVKYSTIVDSKRLEKFEVAFPKDKFINFDKISKYFLANPSLKKLSVFFEKEENNE